MTRLSLLRPIFLACMLLASTGFAMADIVQCVDKHGTVTYTDSPCPESANAGRHPAWAKPVPAKTGGISSTQRYAAAEKARADAWAKKRPRHRRLASDVATARAARSAMRSNDRASTLLRQQKLAALDQKDQSWFNF